MDDEFEAKMLLGDFQPIDEEAQKDVLFVILDGMDHYAKKIDQARSEEEKQRNYELYCTYMHLASFFLKDREWMKEMNFSARGFAIQAAHKMRMEYEGKLNKA